VASTTTPPDRRIVRLRHLAAHLAEVLQADLMLRLWNGEQLPLGPAPGGDVWIAIHSPAAITRMLRSPRLTTLIELFAEGDLDIEGGTLLDVAARRGIAAPGIVRQLDKWLVARALLPFIFGPGGEQTQSAHAYGGCGGMSSTTRDDKALVQFHYDLSNAFYALFLDPGMQYSCGYFIDAQTDLAAAQQAKLDMICRKLRLRPGDRFLDVGCGWGSLMYHAARNYGAHAHGVTLSEAQYEYVREKIRRCGLQGRVTVDLKDYRALDGEYDRIASVGMFEHVGRDNHSAYFAKMRDLLRPRGVMLHHAIARPAKRSERAFRRRRPEYAALTAYIFPGGELDHIGNTLANVERAGFEVHDVECARR